MGGHVRLCKEGVVLVVPYVVKSDTRTAQVESLQLARSRACSRTSRTYVRVSSAGAEAAFSFVPSRRGSIKLNGRCGAVPPKQVDARAGAQPSTRSLARSRPA
jgi:hypothetical protein